MVKKTANNSKISFQGLHKINDLIFNLNKPLIGKKGMHYQKMVKDWSLIIGHDLARYTIPTKILSSSRKGSIENILYIATNNSSASAELAYHLDVIKEQINFYFGYQYIHSIKMVQAVFKVEPQKTLEAPTLSKNQSIKIDELVNEYTQEDNIRLLLLDLATSIVQK